MDVDKDQKISQAEYVTSMSASFASKDKDKDGFLTNAEHTHASFKAFDKNKDGKITKEEYSALFMKQFKNTHDKNKDGFVTSDEM